MKRKYSKDELFKLDAVDIYKLVLNGSLKKFPIGFWRQPETIANAIKCTKYLLENKLKLTDEELKEQLSKKLFKENGLVGMLNYCFKGSPYEAIYSTYPNKFKPWEFKKGQRNYWNIENSINATKWLIEDKLKISDDELKEQLSAKLFKDNGLGGMLILCFNHSPYKAINSTYPNKFKKEEFKNHRKK